MTSAVTVYNRMHIRNRIPSTVGFHTSCMPFTRIRSLLTHTTMSLWVGMSRDMEVQRMQVMQGKL
jgi:hypothetical protein